MKDSKRILSVEEVLCIPFSPMFVLSDNSGSPIAAGIKDHTGSMYNHYMTWIGGGKVASQDLTFKEVHVKEYLGGGHRLKFWWNPTWTTAQSKAVLDAVLQDLRKPWYKKLYDWPAIIGQALDLPWIQTPGIDICSDKARYVAVADPRYNLEHPDPEDVNRWFNETEGYEVYGRYIPD